MNQLSLPTFNPGRSFSRTLVVIVAALAVCCAIDFALIAWIRVGPPAGKGQIFFVELVIMIAAALVVSATAIIAPDTARRVTPFLFVALAWHTGFQVPLDSTGEFVVTVFDVLVPLCLFLGLIGRWYQNSVDVQTWFQQHWRLFAIFWAFCTWGLLLALARGTSPNPMLANLKSFLFYPLIIIILPWCIRSWKQLYWAVGLLAGLIFERTLDGLHQAAIHETSKFMTELVHGQIIYRIDGDMAATNQYAAYLMTGAFILLSVVTASRIRPLYRVLLAGPLALTGLALLLTYSRGAWLGSGIGLLVLLLMLKPRRAFATVGLLAFVGLVIEAVHPGAGSQIVLRANDIDRSIQARETYETTGLQVLMHYPFGAGWGAWFRLVPGGIQAIPGYPWYHDDYLQLATELGIPGLLSLLAILGSVVWTGWTAARKAYDPNNAAIVAGLTAALVGMLVQTATDQFLWHADIAPHIWIVAGLMLSGVMLMRMDDRRRAVIADAIEHAEEEARERDFALPGAQ